VNGGAAQAWFVAGTLPLILGGAVHLVQTLRDTVRPTYFAPTDGSVKTAMDDSDLRLRHMVPGGDRGRPSMWRAWLGFNLSHGLGVLAFGGLCLLIAVHDFALVERIEALEPLAIAFSAAYLAVALRFWFYVPVLITGSATACFTVAALLPA
jgi:hypothetical protein